MKLLIAFTIFLFSYTVMGQKFHTEFEYVDSINKGITIQNSYPKGGLKYTDSIGKEYVYVIFWTCITNETDTDLELSIDFPTESFTITYSPDTYFRLYLPIEEMTIEKVTLFDYGLDLKSFLDENIEKPSAVVKTIVSNESYSFYVVAISNQGLDGVVRAGFELKKQSLFHKINGREINCGRIIVKR